MAAKKENEAQAKPAATLEDVTAQVAEILAQAQQEAQRIVDEAKQAVAKPINSRMSPEELKEYNAYMNEYVEIELFKDSGKYKDDVFVAVNGESCLIKRGERVKIKRKFAEVLDQSMAQRKEAARFMEEKADEWKRVSANL